MFLVCLLVPFSGLSETKGSTTLMLYGRPLSFLQPRLRIHGFRLVTENSAMGIHETLPTRANDLLQAGFVSSP